MLVFPHVLTLIGDSQAKFQYTFFLSNTIRLFRYRMMILKRVVPIFSGSFKTSSPFHAL